MNICVFTKIENSIIHLYIDWQRKHSFLKLKAKNKLIILTEIKENIQHAMKTGLLNIIGGDNGKARKVLQLDIEGNVLRKFNSMAEAGRFLGVEGKPTGISKVCLGNKKTAYGYKWKYV